MHEVIKHNGYYRDRPKSLDVQTPLVTSWGLGRLGPHPDSQC
jgi:hypothetical protein